MTAVVSSATTKFLLGPDTSGTDLQKPSTSQSASPTRSESPGGRETPTYGDLVAKNGERWFFTVLADAYLLGQGQTPGQLGYMTAYCWKECPRQTSTDLLKKLRRNDIPIGAVIPNEEVATWLWSGSYDSTSDLFDRSYCEDAVRAAHMTVADSSGTSLGNVQVSGCELMELRNFNGLEGGGLQKSVSFAWVLHLEVRLFTDYHLPIRVQVGDEQDGKSWVQIEPDQITQGDTMTLINLRNLGEERAPLETNLSRIPHHPSVNY